MLTFSSSQKQELLWWADQLDNTKERQGNGALKRLLSEIDDPPVYEFCCLGIYAECKNVKWFGNRILGIKKNDSLICFSLPITLAEKLGLEQRILMGKKLISLQDLFAIMNDELHLDFPFVATAIRFLVENRDFPRNLKRLLDDYTLSSGKGEFSDV